MVLHDFIANGKHMNNVYLMKLYTSLVVFQSEERCIRDVAWDESNMVKFRAISIPLKSIFGTRNDV